MAIKINIFDEQKVKTCKCMDFILKLNIPFYYYASPSSSSSTLSTLILFVLFEMWKGVFEIWWTRKKKKNELVWNVPCDVRCTCGINDKIRTEKWIKCLVENCKIDVFRLLFKISTKRG